MLTVNAQLNFSCIEKKGKLFSSSRKLWPNPLDQLYSWVDETDCCRWQGIICETTGRNVGMLKLSGFGLGGQVRTPLLDLEQLRYLDLSNSSFERNPLQNSLDWGKK